MSRVILSDVSFHYDDPYEQVFEKLSLTLETSWRTGVIGRNGTGKSTLLRLLGGEIAPRGGHVAMPVETMSFPYAPPTDAVTTRHVVLDSVGPFRALEARMERLAAREDPDSLAAFGRALERYEQLGGYEIEARVERELAALGLDHAFLDRPFASLSGGERTRALIVPLFLRAGVFPLIDEPTNHLDIEGRELLGGYLARQAGFVVVSHDRDLLDACCDHVVAVDVTDVRAHQASYSGWLRQRELTLLYERRRHENLTREVRAMERAARQRRQWSFAKEREKKGAYDKGAVGARAARHMKRALHTERRARESLEEKRSLLEDAYEARSLKLHPESGGPEALVRAQDLVVRYGDRTVLDGVSLSVARGERVAVVGANGCGKTTLLRAIAGDVVPAGGIVSLPSHVETVRAYQEPLWQRGSLREHLLGAGIEEQSFRRVMGSLGIAGDVFGRPLETFSLGQRKKVDLCRSFVSAAHLFIWDEPMNEIDIVTREAIEAAVAAHEPTMLFVEHDRWFVDRVATRVVRLDGGRLRVARADDEESVHRVVEDPERGLEGE